jgi:hypothetical protein
MKPLFVSAALILSSLVMGQDVPKEYSDAADFLGKKGDFKAGVFKIGVPRNDLSMRVDGVDLPTAFGFGGWVAMTKGDVGSEVLMGDLVLLQEEVNPVMSALLENGLEVTALHNHFFWDEPRVWYMHVHGMGSAGDLARKLKPAFDLIGKVAPPAPADQAATPSAVSAGTFDTKALDAIVGKTGEANGQVYKYTIGRDDLSVTEMGARINARMGLNTWAAFYGSDASAVVAGDVAMLESEVTGVLKALRANGLQVVAIHHHMTGTSPMIVFLHYWGKGPATRLAQGFKAALGATGTKSGNRH